MNIDISIQKEDLNFDIIGKSISIKDYEAQYNDTNHVFETPYIVVDEDPNKAPTVTIKSVTKIVPTGKIVVYDNGKWENIEDYKAKHLFNFTCNNINIWKYKIKSKYYGYIFGTINPMGSVKGLNSAINQKGYELWQKIELINI